MKQTTWIKANQVTILSTNIVTLLLFVALMAHTCYCQKLNMQETGLGVAFMNYIPF